MSKKNKKDKKTRKKAKAKIEKKDQLPLIFVSNIVIFPRLILPLFLEKPQSLAAIESALKKDRLVVFMLQPKNKEKPYKVATVARIDQILKTPEGGAKLIIEGISRVKVKEVIQQENFWTAQVETISVPQLKKSKKTKALLQSITSQFRQCVDLGKPVPNEILTRVFNTDKPSDLVNLVVFNLNLEPKEQQEFLETISIKKRLAKVNKFLAKEIEVLKAGQELRQKTAEDLGQRQREVFLRQELENIEEELGTESETNKLRHEIKKANMPKKTEKEALKEIDRLARTPSFSPETGRIRDYLEWLIKIPWSKTSDGKVDIKQAEKVLNEDHYGLKKVKKRVLEYLATQQKVGQSEGPILCFIGPPGTGKTSIGQSIARASNREFIRMSLGGVRDEAEIRGHRRTYVGSIPGRIIQGISRVGTKDPVFMLDEIDKVGKDFRGDPSAALLEVLDPEQNDSFIDHYLDVPFDLSDVVFITTGNVLSSIPSALKDRMEVIRFPGYTVKEKFYIAKKFLAPKQIKKHGLKKKKLSLSDQALKKIVQYYTQEAGVRELERQIAKICRKVNLQMSQGEKRKKFKIGTNELKKFLGPTKHKPTVGQNQDTIGATNGLAWTQAGGQVLSIEATKMPGKGKLTLTGSLGKVMKESATAAFSFAKSYTKNKNWQKQDVHLHVPSGAIPKDGPSAGIAMATTLVSLLEEKPVRSDIAMSGEITLQGKALEVGGVKEKVLAAHRGGIKNIILPKEDEKRVNYKIDKKVRNKVNFFYVENMKQVLEKALVDS